ncbi:GT2 family glycosyltransferase [Streptosporangium becharense]|uniref:GT2 family glycosyltransferase n=1 Tax=Streptosporangium becharense TaxID=1816182 RepID=A0A7W9MG38_9ACTN|nr:glycosyltransferase [Streptosporangium becharense]MBB2909914.1 GT2 family glycosyltransferase [Streptosporangium becharense]MBB5819131.1 GT2 family glycosyltransferase [Streptosporangium becharense]
MTSDETDKGCHIMTGGATGNLPPIRHNDYSPLEVPPLGGWDPHLPVSVVVPARGGQRKLDLALASLAAQTYPGHLLEVIVVDDGSEPPLRLPEIVPPNTRIVPAAPPGWGIAHAVNTGAALAEGRIIQRLDADMVVCREHIEALARWHHLAGYLVAIGAKKFIEEPPAAEPARVRDAVEAGALESVLDLSGALPSSTEETIARTDGLRASRNPYHVCTGPTVSMRREIFHAVGGLDAGVLRGEDTEFAYRLAAHGVVFVPDMAAQAVHLGLPAQRRDREGVVRAVAPYLAHRVPLRRDLRKDRGRHWLVPYVEVVLRADGPQDQVREAVGAALRGTVGDVRVALVAPWSRLPQGRPPAPDDPSFDLLLLREHFSHDERIRPVDEVAATPAPVPFRYTGPVSVPLGHDSLERMIAAMQEDRSGMLVVDLGEDGTATLERTEALGRALLLGADDVAASIEATHGVRHADRSEFWPAPAPARSAQSARPTRPASSPAPAKPTASAKPAASAAEPERRPAPAVQRQAAGTGRTRQAPSGRGSLLGRLRDALRD